MSAIYPCLCYQDAHAAIDWLERAFGARRCQVHEGDDGAVHHAELDFDGGIVMMSSARAGGLSWSTGAASLYLVVGDPDAHHARAAQAGAEIVRELRDEDYGSRGYTARDPEGNLWSFGTYDPAATSA